MTINYWVIAFYVFSILNILLLCAFSNLLSHPRFRSEDGDISTEAGYEEDPMGNIRKREYRFPTQDELDDPHVVMEKFTQ
ncbi:MAG: hypothetical protein K2X93_22640 [Candidatus Obscuribacterales bacterium]|nr:hypothetical protein [Candidatus Obscuribacterales bacterium]